MCTQSEIAEQMAEISEDVSLLKELKQQRDDLLEACKLGKKAIACLCGLCGNTGIDCLSCEWCFKNKSGNTALIEQAIAKAKQITLLFPVSGASG